MSLFGNEKEKVAEILMRAELVSQKNGTSVFETIELYSNEIKKEEKKASSILMKIAKKLRFGKKRWVAYKGYLDDDLLKLLSIASSKSIASGVIFSNFAPIKEISMKYKKSIKSGFYAPLIQFVALSFVFNFVVSEFKILNSMGNTHLSSASMFIIDYFLYITFAITAIIGYFFFIKPTSLPLLKGVFNKLDSMLALSTVSTMFDVGYSSSDVFPLIVKQFKIKKSSSYGKNAGGLVKLLRVNEYINSFESADIKLSIENGTLEESISGILKSRLDEVDLLRDMVKQVVSNISLSLIALPVFMAGSVFIDVLTLITSIAGG